MSALDQIATILDQAQAAIDAARDTAALEEVRIKYLGRKAELPNLLRNVAQLAPEERGATGKAANLARQQLEQAIEAKAAQLATSELEQRLKDDRIDVTLPGDPLPTIGRLHLLTQTRRELEEIFLGLGFNVAEGPEVETAYYNFDALNTPVTHPSRLMTDTFYIEPADDIFDPQARLLRVHTSPVQIRAMERQPPPIYIVMPGRVYRPDSDATHSPQFHQLEGLAVDTDVTLADLPTGRTTTWSVPSAAGAFRSATHNCVTYVRCPARPHRSAPDGSPKPGTRRRSSGSGVSSG